MGVGRVYEESMFNQLRTTHSHPRCIMSVVLDAALTHLMELHENLEDVRDRYPPQEVKDCCNTSVLGLRYRTSIESRWR
jgi:hypothetical protein